MCLQYRPTHIHILKAPAMLEMNQLVSPDWWSDKAAFFFKCEWTCVLNKSFKANPQSQCYITRRRRLKHRGGKKKNMLQLFFFFIVPYRVPAGGLLHLNSSLQTHPSSLISTEMIHVCTQSDWNSTKPWLNRKTVQYTPPTILLFASLCSFLSSCVWVLGLQTERKLIGLSMTLLLFFLSSPFSLFLFPPLLFLCQNKGREAHYLFFTVQQLEGSFQNNAYSLCERRKANSFQSLLCNSLSD